MGEDLIETLTALLHHLEHEDIGNNNYEERLASTSYGIRLCRKALEQAQPAPASVLVPGTGCSACGWTNGDWVCNDKCQPEEARDE